jgi:hypothetical protein
MIICDYVETGLRPVSTQMGTEFLYIYFYENP